MDRSAGYFGCMEPQEMRRLAKEIARANRGSVVYQIVRAALIVIAIIGVAAVVFLAIGPPEL
jgi:hypothetical protein